MKKQKRAPANQIAILGMMFPGLLTPRPKNPGARCSSNVALSACTPHHRKKRVRNRIKDKMQRESRRRNRK